MSNQRVLFHNHVSFIEFFLLNPAMIETRRGIRKKRACEPGSNHLVCKAILTLTYGKSSFVVVLKHESPCLVQLAISNNLNIDILKGKQGYFGSDKPLLLTFFNL